VQSLQPPSSLDCGQLLTTCDIVWRLMPVAEEVNKNDACMCVFVAHCRAATSINSRQSCAYLDCRSSARPVSRWNYGRKVALHRPRLSRVIEFTRRRHICMARTDNDPSTFAPARRPREAPVDGRAWYFCRPAPPADDALPEGN